MCIHQPFIEYCNPPETVLGTGDTKVGKILSYLGFSTVIDIEVDTPSSIPAPAWCNSDVTLRTGPSN